MHTIFEIGRSALKLLLGKGTVRSYSQDGEDILAGVFLRNPKGTYVDVGAYHPVLYSNTYSFYRRGWSGLVIDANQSLRPLYRFFRPRDTFANAGVAREVGEHAYHEFSDGAYNTFSDEEAVTRKAQNYPTYLRTRTLPLRPLRDIIKDAGITQVDFLSIDIEGLDMEALESYDWDMPPRVIAIEDNTFSVEKASLSPAYLFLTAKGYILGALAPRTLIFVKE